MVNRLRAMRREPGQLSLAGRGGRWRRAARAAARADHGAGRLGVRAALGRDLRRTGGRPSYGPVVLLKCLLLQQFAAGRTVPLARCAQRPASSEIRARRCPSGGPAVDHARNETNPRKQGRIKPSFPDSASDWRHDVCHRCPRWFDRAARRHDHSGDPLCGAGPPGKPHRPAIGAPRAASDETRAPGAILVRMKRLEIEERDQSSPDERGDGPTQGDGNCSKQILINQHFLPQTSSTIGR